MKIFTPFVLTLLFCTTAFSQTDSISERKNTIGLEVTYLLGQFLGSPGDFYVYYPLNGPYILGYERNFNKCFFRSGFSMIYNSNDMDGNYPYGADYSDERLTASYRFGFGHEKMISKRWKWAYGIDLIGYNEDYSSMYYEGLDYEYSSKNKTFSYGGGPFIKLSFDLLKNFSLGTESTIYYKQGKTKNNVNYANYPEQDYNSSNFTRSVNINYPMSIWASFNF